MKGKGYLIFILLLFSILGSYYGIQSLNRTRSNRNEQLLKDEKLLIIKGCKDNSGELTKKYPSVINWYCSCMADTLINHYSYEQLVEQDKMPAPQRAKLLEPLLKPLSVEAFKRIQQQGGH